MKLPYLVVFLALFSARPSVQAATVPDRKAAVLNDRAAMEDDPRWIYNDYDRGFAEAKKTGKPLLIVLRCIPCLACYGIDTKVLLENSDLTPLLDKFVCVRVINANALDLSRFQFDFDLSFTTIFFNGDGTVYGRYGSWVHQKDPNEQATDGFRKALEAALQIHHGYPANKASLTGKQPRPTTYKSPLDLPALQGKYTRNLDWEGKVVASCVHCHQIGEATRADYRHRKEAMPARLIYPFPAPETVGFELALDSAARVKSVVKGSPADKAGLRQGDDMLSLDGQILLSIADVSWALHQAAETAALPVVVRRDNKETKLTLALPENWRSHSDISRRVGTWSMRAMAFGGLMLQDLSDEERRRHELSQEQLALEAKHVGEYGEHAAAKKAGFQKGDIIVELAGLTGRQTEGEMMGHLLKDFQPGQSVKATVLRGDKKLELNLPIQ